MAKLIKYICIGFTILLVTVCILIMGAILALKTDRVQKFIQNQINAVIPGSLQWERLRFSLIRGDFEVTNLTLKGISNEELAGVDHISMGLQWSELRAGNIVLSSVIIEKPSVVIRIERDGSLNLATALTPVIPREGKNEAGSNSVPLPFNIVIKDLAIKDGSLRYSMADSNFRAAIDTVTISADAELAGMVGGLVLKIGNGVIGTGEGEASFNNLELKTRLEDRVLTLDTFRGNIAEGNLEITGQMDFRKAFPEGLIASVPDFDVVSYIISFQGKGIDIGTIFKGSDIKGLVSSSFSLEGTGLSPQTLVALLKGEIRAEKVAVGTGTTSPVDIKASLKANLDRGIATVEKLDARAGAITAGADGTIDLASRAIAAHLELNAPDLSDTLSSLGMDGVQGEAHIEATLSGTEKQPLLLCRIDGKGFVYQGFRIGNVHSTAELDKSGLLRLQKFNLRSGDSDVYASGEVRLFDDRGLLENPSFQLDFRGKSIFLGDFDERLKGELSLSGRLKGTKDSPEGIVEIQGRDVDSGVQKISGFGLSAALDGKKIHVSKLTIGLVPGENIEGSGWVSLDRTYKLHLASRGISLGSIDSLKDQKIAEGSIAFNISSEGLLDNPSLIGTAVFHGIQIDGREFEDLKIDINLSNGLAKASGRLNFNFDGSYHLREKDFQVSADFKESNLTPYFEIAGKSDLKGVATGNLIVKGNTNALNRMEGSADFSELTFYFRGLQLLHTGNLHAEYLNKEFILSPCHLDFLREGYLDMEGKGKADGPILLKIDGKLPMSLAVPFVEDITDITGSVLISARVEGPQSDPDIRGRLTLQKIGFTLPVLLQKLHDVNGIIEIIPEIVNIKEINGKVDSGNFDIKGTIDIKDFQPGQIDITATATALPLLLPDIMETLLNAKLKISGAPEQSSLQGEVVLLEGTYYRDVNLDLLRLVKERKREVESPPSEINYPFVKNMKLDLSVKGRNPFLIENNIAHLQVSPDLVFVGTINNPLIKGRAEVNSGTVTYYKRTFDVKKGTIDFLNPYKIEPTIDIAAKTQVKKWLISLRISGTPDRLAFDLTSEPYEEAADIVSLLLLGKTAKEFAALEGGATLSTKEMLAEMIATTFAEDIKKTTGLDILEVQAESTEEEKATSESIKVTLGKQLTKRMTVKYAAETKDGEMIQRAIAEYQLLENILLNGFQDSKGIFGGEVLFRLEFR